MINATNIIQGIIKQDIKFIENDIEQIKNDKNNKIAISLVELMWNRITSSILNLRIEDKEIVKLLFELTLEDIRNINKDLSFEQIMDKGNKILIVLNKILLLV